MFVFIDQGTLQFSRERPQTGVPFLELPSSVSAANEDEILLAVGGAFKRLSMADLKAFIASDLVPAVPVSTFSSINTDGLSKPTLFLVDIDESSDGNDEAYFFNGSVLKWLPMVEV